MGLCLVFEPATGIRASLTRTLNEFSETRMERAPTIRSKAYFRLSWLHGLVTERLRYTPLGWSKHYEINESDLRFACDTIDQWISNQGKEVVLFCFIELRTKCFLVFRGNRLGCTSLFDRFLYLRRPIRQPVCSERKISTINQLFFLIFFSFDQRLLASFVAKFFCEQSLQSTYPLIKDDFSSLLVPLPQETSKHKYVDWVKNLPANEKPTWLGLPDNAEKVLLISEGPFD